MYTVLMVVYLIVVLALIGIILFQRSSSDGLGSLSGGGNNMMSGRTQANLLTRTTAILASLFILLALGLGVLVKSERRQSFGDALESGNAIPAPAVDAKDTASDAAGKKADEDAGKAPAAAAAKTPSDAKKVAAPVNPAAPSVPKGE